MTVLWAALAGYASAFTGFFSGALLSRAPKREASAHIITGLSAGLLTAFICFEMLPPALTRWGLFKGIGCLLAGVAFAACMQRVETEPESYGVSPSLTAGIMLHNLPEGVALGAMMRVSMPAGLLMAVILAAHCLPEALMLFAGSRKPPRWFFCGILALPMALGSVAGCLFGASAVLVDVCLTFAAGMMLYIACGKMLPGDGERRSKYLALSGAAAGFAAGVLLTAL